MLFYRWDHCSLSGQYLLDLYSVPEANVNNVIVIALGTIFPILSVEEQPLLRVFHDPCEPFFQILTRHGTAP